MAEDDFPDWVDFEIMELKPGEGPDYSDQEMQRRRYAARARSAHRGIRPNSLRRLVLLNEVIRYEIEEYHGPAFEEVKGKIKDDEIDITHVLQRLNTELLYLLQEAATDLLTDEDSHFIFDISERTAQDYVKSLRVLHHA